MVREFTPPPGPWAQSESSGSEGGRAGSIGPSTAGGPWSGDARPLSHAAPRRPGRFHPGGEIYRFKKSEV